MMKDIYGELLHGICSLTKVSLMKGFSMCMLGTTAKKII